MKPTLALFLVFACVASAEETSRKWTDTQGRSIEGKLVAKSKTHASVLLANGKRAELPLEKLDAESKSYVESATLIKEVAPSDLVSARITGTSKGQKTVEVTANAGEKELVVTATAYHVNIKKTVKPGESIKFEFRAVDDYKVTGAIDGQIVDTEDSRKKTGL